jgi:hypothetical protein
MSHGSPDAGLSSSPDDSWKPEPEPAATKWAENAPVPGVDIVEIATSLRQLSDVLERSALVLAASGALPEETDFWLDEDHLYAEVLCSEGDRLMMDICVQGGRAFIRVERDGLGVELVELPA